QYVTMSKFLPFTAAVSGPFAFLAIGQAGDVQFPLNARRPELTVVIFRPWRYAALPKALHSTIAPCSWYALCATQRTKPRMPRQNQCTNVRTRLAGPAQG